MESLVALGLAANAVQFIDFTARVLTQTHRIYHNKPLHRNSQEIEDLHQLSFSIVEHSRLIEVQNSVRQVVDEPALHKRFADPASSAKPSSRNTLTKAMHTFKSLHTTSEELDDSQDQLHASMVARFHDCDKQIIKICCSCEEISQELQMTMKRLQTSKDLVWKSFTEALKSVWGEEKIQILRDRLREHRHQLTFLMSASARDKIEIFRIQQDQNHSDLYQATKTLRNRLEFLLGNQEQLRSDIIDAVREAHHSKDPPSNGVSQRDMTPKSLQDFHKGLLRWISFAELDTRYEKVDKAHESTFEWVFHAPPEGRWSDFTKWMEDEDEHLYWITGKPAAGKSTLLKFIHNDPRTTEHLKCWAKDKTLVHCAFYFWNSGTPMQKSEEAMVRTLLHAALLQAPDLWSDIFPSKMEEFILFSNPWKQPITPEEAKTALQLLVKNAGPKYRLFFFIDGLDEFGGDHDALITTIQSMLSPNVKTCVSSRRWPLFEDGFRQSPSLRLEALTRNDIKRYVTNRFEDNDGFQDLEKETPKEARQLIEDITSKASGVFLWVRLVTDRLLNGLTKGERVAELQEHLSRIPADLEALYWNTLNHLEKRYRTDMSQIFQIIRGTLKPLTLLELSYADDPDPNFLSHIAFGQADPEKMGARASRMRRRLKTRCQGLIDAEPEHNQRVEEASVTYLHRTVRDYLEQDDIWSKFLAMTDESFHLPVRLLHVHEANLKTTAKAHFDPKHWEQILYAIEYAIMADPKYETGEQQKLLTDVDNLMTQMAHRTSLDPTKHWSASSRFGTHNTCFLHLAIQLQLTDYVKHFTPLHLAAQPDPLTKQREATTMLLLATLHYDVFAKMPHIPFSLSILRHAPSAELITLFLSQGADPDAKHSNALQQHGSIAGNFSAWETHLREPKRDTAIWIEVAKVFLQYGADPGAVVENKGAFPEEVVRVAEGRVREGEKGRKGFRGVQWGVRGVWKRGRAMVLTVHGQS
ncbi:hypothetical protein IQ07DRAFT_647357 [Pyrenochaeta sp. DS3sAY3a]|nr:hypothetical protein IQ07DRAFT_647357 [Pyrenochaeta sp. DS3sAY3a]